MGGEEEGEILGSKVAAVWKLAGHWSVCGRWHMTAFASLVFFLFPPLIKLSLPEPTSFHAFFFPIVSASGGTQVGSEQVAA